MINRFLAIVLTTLAISMLAFSMDGNTDKSGTSKSNMKGTSQKEQKQQKNKKNRKNDKPKRDKTDEEFDRLLMGIYG
jgi:Flp pilus assembly protein TadB